MSLTIGQAPFGPRRIGHFEPEVPDHVVYVAPLPRRVRARRGGEVVVDSQGAMLVHETGKLPAYAFPPQDVWTTSIEDARCPGYVAVAWDSVDAWFEEDEQILGHPRDPFTRIDTFATSRQVHVEVAGAPLARSTRAVALFETGLPVVYYLPAQDVRMERLQPSDTRTRCAYKGEASHWSAVVDGIWYKDVAWSYDGPVQRDARDVQGLIAFYADRVEVQVL